MSLQTAGTVKLKEVGYFAEELALYRLQLFIEQLTVLVSSSPVTPCSTSNRSAVKNAENDCFLVCSLIFLNKSLNADWKTHCNYCERFIISVKSKAQLIDKPRKCCGWNAHLQHTSLATFWYVWKLNGDMNQNFFDHFLIFFIVSLSIVFSISPIYCLLIKSAVSKSGKIGKKDTDTILREDFCTYSWCWIGDILSVTCKRLLGLHFVLEQTIRSHTVIYWNTMVSLVGSDIGALKFYSNWTLAFIKPCKL